LGIEISILQKWMEPKKVLEAIAHLYCELYTRHLVVGLVRAGERLTLDLTQYELADAVGGSLVHTNKSARILKNQRLVKFSTGRSTVLNFEGLAKHSEFTTSYLGSLVTCEAQTKPIGTWQ
jgi:hypothetical protein